MSLTVKELLLNHSRGASSPVQNSEGQYFDTEIPIFKDLNDRTDYNNNLKAVRAQLNDDIKADKAQHLKDKKLAEKQLIIDEEAQLAALNKKYPKKIQSET